MIILQYPRKIHFREWNKYPKILCLRVVCQINITSDANFFKQCKCKKFDCAMVWWRVRDIASSSSRYRIITIVPMHHRIALLRHRFIALVLSHNRAIVSTLSLLRLSPRWLTTWPYPDSKVLCKQRQSITIS